MKAKNKWWLLLLLPLLLLVTAIAMFFMDTDGIPVLNYHQINDRDHNALTVSTEQFAAQMQYLTDNGYHTITGEELADALDGKIELPDNPVLITFDDGYRDNYKNAFPILGIFGVRGACKKDSF